MRSGSTECVSILIINDTVQEPTEVFLVTLRTSNAIRLGNYIARVEIVDDDGKDVGAVWYLIISFWWCLGHSLRTSCLFTF